MVSWKQNDCKSWFTSLYKSFKALNLINNKSNNTDVKFVIGSEDIHDVSSVDAQR